MAINGRTSRECDRIVLALMCREAMQALRSIRPRDAVWILGGGGLLVAYASGDAFIALRAAAEALRGRDTLWWFGVPAACLAVGVVGGLALGRIVAARAHAPFLAALPLSDAERRRMAAFALVPFCICAASPAVALAASAAASVGRPVLPVALAALAASAVGFSAGGAGTAGRRPRSSAIDRTRGMASRGLPLDAADRPGLAWIGSWAWNVPAGRLWPTPRLLLAAAVLSLGVVLSVGSSLARRDAGPAAAAAVVAGVSSFMLALRCRPLASPALRSAPVGFLRAWSRLMRLPALLSASVFLLPAGAALAAEPSAWMEPATGAIWVTALNLVYAVFAAAFFASPALSVLGFAATLGYAAYESLEYGSAVYLAVAGLVAVLLRRARRRFRHG